jgi:hypothetical protein
MIVHTLNRHFGYIFSAIFTFAAIFFMQDSIDVAWSIFLFICSLFILILSIFSPRLLSPFYRAWMALGHLLGQIVSPIVLGLIFFFLITPTSLVGRLAGRDPLRLKSRAISSYWIKREPAGPAPDSFRNQF